MKPGIELVNRCRRLLDGPARDINHRPGIFRKQLSRVADFSLYRIDIDIIRLGLLMQHQQTVAADLDQPVG